MLCVCEDWEMNEHQENFDKLKVIGAETRLKIIRALQEMSSEKEDEIRTLTEKFNKFRNNLAAAHDSEGKYAMSVKARDEAWKLVSDGAMEDFWKNVADYKHKQGEVEKIEDVVMKDHGGSAEATHVAKAVAAQLKVHSLLDQMHQVATNAQENLNKTELDK